MITCQEATRQLYEYLDKELSELDSAKIEEHLKQCQKCCGRFEFEKTLRSIVHDKARSSKIPTSLRDKIVEVIEGRR